jgi:Ca2+-transporting ATPase
MTEVNFDKTLNGLSESEANQRLKTIGYNELPSSKPKTIFHIVYHVIREPMFLMLVACGMLYLMAGELQDALMLLGFVFVMMGITIYQERKTERALDALKDLSSPRALVVRDGVQRRIAGREVVEGDLIVLSEGDRVPADAAIVHTTGISTDESLLTGESVPVSKKTWEEEVLDTQPGGDDLPFIYSGTLVVQGQGMARVYATGMSTELGKIGKALQGVKEEETRLNKEVRSLVKYIAIFGIGLCVLAIIIFGITRGDWMKAVLNGLTLAMALLPEEFPVVLTIFMALGAWRMSKKNVLTRRVPAIETLGSATVLCTDKTGTLTQNRMTVQELYNGKDFVVVDATRALPAEFEALVFTSAKASSPNPFDPMEKAFHTLFDTRFKDSNLSNSKQTLEKEYPLSHDILAMANAWRNEDGSRFVAAKGSPEAIMKLCKMNPVEIAEVETKIIAMAANGLRVLGVAAVTHEGEWHAQITDYKYQLLGLIGLADPPRETVPAAVKECYHAGIRIIMITGDYPGTALAIAKQIGLKNPEEIITGPELSKMSEQELAQRIDKVTVFARVVPEQKLLIVNALKARGEVVAMTGDGVNDAPALKSANIGIAMGERGTDVARESASLVLVDDDFSSIVSAVRMGRRIYDNLKKASAYIFSIHVPIAGMSLIPLLYSDLPLILYPIHVVFLELIIDPACSVVFEMEPEEKHVMDKPPRSLKTSIFSLKMVGVSILQGLSVLLIVGLVYWYGVMRDISDEQVRALAFCTLVFSNIGLIVSNRSWSESIFTILKRPNPAMLWLVGGVIALTFTITSVPFLNNLFKFAPLHKHDVLICFGMGLLSIAWFELLKLMRRRRIQKEGKY